MLSLRLVPAPSAPAPAHVPGGPTLPSGAPRAAQKRPRGLILAVGAAAEPAPAHEPSGRPLPLGSARAARRPARLLSLNFRRIDALALDVVELIDPDDQVLIDPDAQVLIDA